MHNYGDQVWPWAAEHACEQARSRVLHPKIPLLPFGAHVAIRTPIVEGTRKGFKPRADVGRLLVNRSTSSRDAVILVTGEDGEHETRQGSTPVLLTEVPLAYNS